AATLCNTVKTITVLSSTPAAPIANIAKARWREALPAAEDWTHEDPGDRRRAQDGRILAQGADRIVLRGGSGRDRRRRFAPCPGRRLRPGHPRRDAARHEWLGCPQATARTQGHAGAVPDGSRRGGRPRARTGARRRRLSGQALRVRRVAGART